MKICPNCQTRFGDDAGFCPNCGVPLETGAWPGNEQPYMPYQQMEVQSPYDHTGEFSQKDISESKLYCMLTYLLGIIGIIVALLACGMSQYAQFHVRQATKITVCEALMLIAAMLLCWTLIVPIAYAVMQIVLLVVRVICFVQVCSGKAIEAAIVRSIPFMR